MARKHFLVPLISTILISASGWADFESAAETYRMRNYAAAFQQFLPLAEQGDRRAQTIIAMMYKYGEAVEEDKAESFRWYSKAAEQGYAPAQFQLGEMYAEGIGVERNLEMAIAWLSNAADGGFAKAAARLSELDAGGHEVAAKKEPVPWSQPWNLRLPDDVRFGDKAAAPPTEPDEVTDIYRVQLGAMRSLASANRLWSIIRDPNRDLFNGLEPIFKSSLPGTKVLYRLQTGPFDSILTAKRFCDQLMDRGVTTGCLPIYSSDDSNS